MLTTCARPQRDGVGLSLRTYNRQCISQPGFSTAHSLAIGQLTMQKLQTLHCTFPFYNFINCDQLHIKICPDNGCIRVPYENMFSMWDPCRYMYAGAHGSPQGANVFVGW